MLSSYEDVAVGQESFPVSFFSLSDLSDLSLGG